MSRDYKTPSKSTSSKKGNPLLTGLLIGLFVGLAAAVGVALYIKGTPSPFSEPAKQPQPDPVSSSAAAKLPEDLSAEPKTKDQPSKTPDKPRFDFYNILPGREEPITEQDIKLARKQPQGSEVYYLQAGAFQNENDADNLKAKLALLGVEAVIQTASLPEKGVWHRVRTGPYTSIEEADKMRALLVQNKISATLIKVKDTAQ